MFVINDELSAAYPTAEMCDAFEIPLGPHKPFLPKKKKTNWLDPLHNCQFQPNVSADFLIQRKC